MRRRSSVWRSVAATMICMSTHELVTAGHPSRAIALIAHDAQKEAILRLVVDSREALAGERLLATATTGRAVAEHAALAVECVASGPLGGDLQIGGRVAAGEVKLVIFLRDPLAAHPHDPDIQALMKVCDIHHIPLATNRATARLCLEALHRDAARVGELAGAP
jgi:methylglyoxal synthase